jgi:hypothetical protein
MESMTELIPVARDAELQAIFKELRILREQHNMMARAVKAMHDEITKAPERDGTMKKSLYVAGQIALMILASIAVFFLVLAVRPSPANAHRMTGGDIRRSGIHHETTGQTSRGHRHA